MHQWTNCCRISSERQIGEGIQGVYRYFHYSFLVFQHVLKKERVSRREVVPLSAVGGLCSVFLLLTGTTLSPPPCPGTQGLRVVFAPNTTSDLHSQFVWSLHVFFGYSEKKNPPTVQKHTRLGRPVTLNCL